MIVDLNFHVVKFNFDTIEKCVIVCSTPTLDATPGDLSLVMPKRILDGIIEMIYALDNMPLADAWDRE